MPPRAYAPPPGAGYRPSGERGAAPTRRCARWLDTTLLSHGFSAARAGAPPAKSTTLWVGKIAGSVEPQLVRALLEACGALREWKPATDAETGRLKGFGFCTYQEAEGVVVALQVLNDFSVDGMKLALKCNSVRLPIAPRVLAAPGRSCCCLPALHQSAGTLD